MAILSDDVDAYNFRVLLESLMEKKDFHEIIDNLREFRVIPSYTILLLHIFI